MAQVRIECDRGDGWKVRAEGEHDITAETLAAQLPAYAIQYDHRAFWNGQLVGEVRAKCLKQEK